VELDGKVALVTGGSRGIGRAIVGELAGAGATVCFTYVRGQREADALVAEQVAAGRRVFARACDVADLSAIAALLQELDTRWPEGLDIVVNNAGVMPSGAFAELSEAQFDRAFDVNVKGVFFTTQAALSRMRDGGRVVNIGTGLTRLAAPDRIAYAASKGAVDVFTRSLAAAVGARGITVNTVAPGAILTGLNPWLGTEEGARRAASVTAIPRVGLPRDVASVVRWVVSPAAGWVTGQRIEASGGVKL